MFSRKKFHEKWDAGVTKLKENCYRTDHGVTLYNTRIVDYSERGVVRLFSGGYRTQSTKTHMNEVLKAMFCEAYVFQEKGTWFVRCADGVHPFTEGFELRQSN